MSAAGIPFPIDVPVDSEIGITQFSGRYTFLAVVHPNAEVGVSGGVGWFDATASVDTDFGSEATAFDTPFPVVGGHVLVNPTGRLRFRGEADGFWRVTVDNFSGWQFKYAARVEYFFTQPVGITGGYRSYRVTLADDDTGLGFDLNWGGFVVGGVVRY